MQGGRKDMGKTFQNGLSLCLILHADRCPIAVLLRFERGVMFGRSPVMGVIGMIELILRWDIGLPKNWGRGM